MKKAIIWPIFWCRKSRLSLAGKGDRRSVSLGWLSHLKENMPDSMKPLKLDVQVNRKMALIQNRINNPRILEPPLATF